MTHTFADALPVVLREEGGFSDNAEDPGGITNLGVTARTWAAWTGTPAPIEVMDALTPDRVSPLYKAWFWDRIAGDQLPDGVNLAVFDFAVNRGPKGAAEMLQSLVGTVQDGNIGPASLAAIGAYIAANSAAELVQVYCDRRAAYYRDLPDFATFGRGWLNRVGFIEGVALSWLT